MSFSLVPLPSQLMGLIQPRQQQIEKDLGVKPCGPIDTTDPLSLYVWSGELFESLKVLGLTEFEAKRKIAEVLRVTSDPCWSAKTRIPLRGSTARHRVIARLARERRWHSIWSLNWDVWLERALASVGVEHYKNNRNSSATLPQGWIRWYESWVPSKVIQTTDQQTVIVYKPHGCVDSLLDGDGTFVLTQEELARCLTEQPPLVENSMKLCFTQHSLIATGWSASEPYLQEFFSQLKPFRSAGTSLTVIDPFPNDKGHAKLREAYDCEIVQAICKPEADEFPNTDDVFLWIQTRHGLGCLQAIAIEPQRAVVSAWLDQFSTPQAPDSQLGHMVGWFDNFLAVWLRLCFNNGHQKFFTGLPIRPDAIPTHRRDEHIPWDEQNTARNDLSAALNLLYELETNSAVLPRFDYGFFPGALWDRDERHLIVPVPAWAEGATQSLAALKPLVESRHWANQGQIRKISILGLAPLASKAVSEDVQLNWTYELSRLIHFAGVATLGRIGWLDLDSWKDYL
ncbi:SIR2-like domain-containing protein [Variovorax sp. OV700]|nr:SIR2-like domain-containing protein [Variovorax sp. OV700]